MFGTADRLAEHLARATTLEERASAGVPLVPEQDLEERADRVASHWVRDVPFRDPALFQHRLNSLGQPATAVRRALGSAPVFDPLAPPRWATRLLGVARGPEAPHEDFCWTEDGHAGRLLGPFRPLIDDTLAGIRRRLMEHADVIDVESLLSTLRTKASMDTFDLVDRVVVSELHRARKAGVLHAETPEARFDEFVGQFGPDALPGLLTEYPVLGRLLEGMLTGLERTVAEVTDAFARDEAALRGFAGGVRGRLVDLGMAGDPHPEGVVCICTTDAGDRIAYKPRDLGLEQAYGELVTWFNGLECGPRLRAPRVLPRRGYGWVEFIAPTPSGDHQEIQTYYRNCGALLALLTAVGAVDAHQENIVAAGTDPVLIDAESLLQPALRTAATRTARPGQTGLYQSVLSTGMLPNFATGGSPSDAVHFGGIATHLGEPSPVQTRAWAGLGTDEIRPVLESHPVPVGHNVPRLDGSPVPAVGYRAEIEAGFTVAYDAIAARREEIRTGPLNPRNPTQVRVILRETRTYEMLRREGTHPGLLRDGLARDRFIDKLWRAAGARPHLIPAIPAEHRALSHGHVPRFETAADSRDLPVGDQVLSDFFARSGDQVLADRLAALGPDDRERQLWLLRATLAVSDFNAGRPSDLPAVPLFPATREGADALGHGTRLELATHVVSRLEALGIREDDRLSWLGTHGGADGAFTLRPLGTDLYEGVPGVVLFLAHHAALTGESRSRRMAEEALAGLEAQLRDPAARPKAVGPYVGWAGLAYMFAHLGALWDRPELLDRAHACLREVDARIQDDEALDLFSGASGAIVVALTIHAQTGNHAALETAKRCGDHLATCLAAPPTTDAGSKRSPYERGLCGLSHGAAGAAWALLSLHEATGETQYATEGERALEHERAAFDPDRGNWPDLRHDHTGEAPQFCSYWCNGAAGIGLGRAALHRATGRMDVLPEIRAAVDATSVAPEVDALPAHSLCHGLLGNLELLEAGAELGIVTPSEHRRATDAAVVDMIQRGVGFGTPMGLEVPGLMTGLAGIGLALLRQVDPKLPSVLLLEGPEGTR